MSDVEDIVDQTSGQGCGFILYLAPLVMFAVVIVLYAWFGWHVYDGRPADGERVLLHVEACEQADSVLADRLSQMGLQPTLERRDGEVVVVDVVLPSDARVASAIPVTLVEVGRFEVRTQDGEEILVSSDQVEGALARLNVMMQPRLGVALSEEAIRSLREIQRTTPNAQLSFWLDGYRIGGQTLLKQFTAAEVEVALSDVDERIQMEKIAGWAVSIGTPLPCAASVLSTTAPQP